MFTLILAKGEIQSVITIVVIVISIASWIVNVIQGNTPDGNPRAKPKPKPQPDRSEIETLLKELTGAKSKPRPEAERKPQPQPQRSPQPAQDRKRPRPPVAGTPAKPIQVPPAERRPVRVAEAPLPSSDLGAAVRTHHLANRVEASVEKDIVEPVRQDLTGRHAMAPVPSAERAVHPLVKMLREPNGVQRAVVMNEILQRPKALRR